MSLIVDWGSVIDWGAKYKAFFFQERFDGILQVVEKGCYFVRTPRASPSDALSSLDINSFTKTVFFWRRSLSF